MADLERLEYNKKQNATQREAYQKDPIGKRLIAKKHQANKLGIEFNLTQDWFLAHFNICEVTGIELNLDKNSPWNAEIDRIHPGGNYTMDNCRLVCAIYNRAKMNYTDQDVLILAESLLSIRRK